uniref:Uncharacterized protein n=1 Tax=Edwardsiella tarda TaxID=636 RepID=B4XQ49_EDWTA|nr:unknown [Edwardsiella tarda]
MKDAHLLSSSSLSSEMFILATGIVAFFFSSVRRAAEDSLQRTRCPGTPAPLGG